MGAKLRRIHIENFRSIQRVSITVDDLAIFVGKNDCGKSNILRALNLFFNGVTNPGKPFVFEDDYNLFVPDRAKTAKEIVVRVELDIPESYRGTNGQIIVWEKRWRASGLHSSEYWGYRLTRNRRGNEVRTQVKIPERSNAHALLRQIEFEYVPAIKDARYFDELRGRIYSIISEVAARTFRTSSTAFEDSIGDHLVDLTQAIGGALGFETRLALPRDLSPIFQRLDFLSGQKAISLDHRGDGIKTRHIPLILKFMAEKKRSLQGRGAAPYSFIWAYEEPENNLEFASAIALAAQLAGYAASGVAQILLTTHSPVFYDLGGSTGVSCCHVFRETDEAGTNAEVSASQIDANLGTLALLKPRLTALVQNMRDQIEATISAEKLVQDNRPKVFVEGESDRIVLRRCANVFHPQRAALVDFETKREGGGHNYVVDMLVGWRAHHKHHPGRPKAAGILDWDAAEQKKEWNALPSNIASAKCFLYPKPQHAIAALQAGFKLEVTLEVLYSQAVWDWAEGQGYLEDATRADTYPPTLVEQMLRGETGTIQVDPQFAMYINRKFRPGTKVDTASHISKLSEERIRAEFPSIGDMLSDIFDFLGVNVVTA
ncbi:DUF2813 domain-containing protein [Mesorhizobium sp. M00.F.Ca.ET.170.01.1.1]|nr:DUF2813 domain-containing protein [Mesorhizobium sp. M00.F.Ca.ET.170.01.1.1]